MASQVYAHEALVDLPGVTFSTMRELLMAQVQIARLRVLEDAPQRVTIETAHGLVGLRPGVTAEAAGMVAATDEHWLFVMKNAVTQQMQDMLPTLAEAMRWSDANEQTTLPPNFTFVRVHDVRPLGPEFLRVTLEGEDLSRHGNDAIHFRLVQPPIGYPVEWPGLAPNGSVQWPDGLGAPHRPVYTTRSIDYRRNRLVTDVFVHEGGRTTAWAQKLMSGSRDDRIVGVLGPSGGGILSAKNVLMASDETGFPAAARLLENLPENATGTLYLEAEHGAACAYPFIAPEGIDLVWLSRAKGHVLADAVLSALPSHRGAQIWFAGERKQAMALRTAAKDAGWEASALRISAFWRAEGDV
ncbi:MAG: siderophore-interacting protein [Pseudomonadota bacterium]